MAEISITPQTDDSSDGFVFDVAVDEHFYIVTLAQDYYRKLTNEKISPEELVRKSFEFLLEREEPESILPEFDLPLIGRYFPEYEEEMKIAFEPAV